MLESQSKPEEFKGKVVLVGGSSRIPAIRDLVKDYFGAEPIQSEDRDKIVAYGAAIHAEKVANNEVNGNDCFEVLP